MLGFGQAPFGIEYFGDPFGGFELSPATVLLGVHAEDSPTVVILVVTKDAPTSRLRVSTGVPTSRLIVETDEGAS